MDGFPDPCTCKSKHYVDVLGSLEHMEDPEMFVRYEKQILFISSRKILFTENDALVYTVFDLEKMDRELKRYLLKHLDDYDQFAVKRESFTILISFSEIDNDSLIAMYYTRKYVEKAFSYSKGGLPLLLIKVHRETVLRVSILRIPIAHLLHGNAEENRFSGNISRYSGETEMQDLLSRDSGTRTYKGSKETVRKDRSHSA